MTIDVQPASPCVGDRVYLSGFTDHRNIIAVYLFVTGRGLDRAGVTLENLNLPAGRGYFTSAYVHPDGSWAYEWDTAFIAGTLEPGTYRLYVVNVPLNLGRLSDEDEISMAFANVTFQEAPVTPGLPLGAPIVCCAIALSMLFACIRKRNE